MILKTETDIKEFWMELIHEKLCMMLILLDMESETKNSKLFPALILFFNATSLPHRLANVDRFEKVGRCEIVNCCGVKELRNAIW
jgi:hypothetical protein